MGGHQVLAWFLYSTSSIGQLIIIILVMVDHVECFNLIGCSRCIYFLFLYRDCSFLLVFYQRGSIYYVYLCVMLGGQSSMGVTPGGI